MSKEDDSPRLVYNRRRVSASEKGMDSLGLLPNFTSEKIKKRARRHSMVPPSLRRVSLDITEQQRMSLQLPRFSQVFGFSTFSGLPLIGYKDPELHYENTYKMEPEKKFQPHLVKEAVEKVIDDLLDWDDDVLNDDNPQPKTQAEKDAYANEKHKRRSKLIMKMVEEVKDEVKQLKFERYKFVVNAMIGEVKGQDVRVASRCLWDTNRDSFLCVQREGRHGFVTVLVHGVYYE